MIKVLTSFWRGLREGLAMGDLESDIRARHIQAMEAQGRQKRWDDKWLQMAWMVSTWSKDRGTKVGCVIVGPHQEVRSIGYNGFPRGADDAEVSWHQRPLKYLATEHGERNAIYNAARLGVSLQGCTLYLHTSPSRLGPCADCGRAIAQSGISRVVQMGPLDDREDWKESCEMALTHLRNAGVSYEIQDAEP